VSQQNFALAPDEFLRSIRASRDTLDKPEMRLIEIVSRVRELTHDAPYAVIGGLAQILWARKSHTDDLDVALAADVLDEAYQRILSGQAAPEWAIPDDAAREADDVFEVVHLLHAGAVVDLLSFRDAAFSTEIIQSARPVSQLGMIRFIRPELLLCTHLLRPGPNGALAAIELLIARRAFGAFDLDDARKWAAHVGRVERLDRVIAQADAMSVV
jgi:hypothetical protein